MRVDLDQTCCSDTAPEPTAVSLPLPSDHPLRQVLAREVHSRPPTPARAPAVVSSLTLVDAAPAALFRAFCELAAHFGRAVPTSPDLMHAEFVATGMSAKWERHGEFVSFAFVRSLPDSVSRLESLSAFPTAFDAIPAAWLASLEGRTIAAADILMIKQPDGDPDIAPLSRWFDVNHLAGAQALDGAAWLFTDFVLHASGRTRWLAFDVHLGQAQSARLAQRLIEIETYRMTALLAFPVARALLPELGRVERELERITSDTAGRSPSTAGGDAGSADRRLLDELSALAAELQRSVATSAFRFSAARAYWDLVRARVGELREQRIGDMRTLGGFLSRRMEPAMNSCAAVARRQEDISARIERAGSLLRTRVDIVREEQNQRMLASMDARARQQLRLQQTVEALSIAAVTYYAVGLVRTLVVPLQATWPYLDPAWITAAAIPIIGLAVWHIVRRTRQRIAGD